MSLLKEAYALIKELTAERTALREQIRLMVQDFDARHDELMRRLTVLERERDEALLQRDEARRAQNPQLPLWSPSPTFTPPGQFTVTGTSTGSVDVNSLSGQSDIFRVD